MSPFSANPPNCLTFINYAKNLYIIAKYFRYYPECFKLFDPVIAPRTGKRTIGPFLGAYYVIITDLKGYIVPFNGKVTEFYAN